jgi:hypothetical protein
MRTQEQYVFRRLLETPEPFIARLMGLYDEFANAQSCAGRRCAL